MHHEPLTPAVLHVLMALAQGHRHGYAIMQAVEESGGPRIGPGTVYGSLQRMQDAGLVVEAEADGRRRNFAMTERGRTALEGEAARLAAIARQLEAAGFGKEAL